MNTETSGVIDNVRAISDKFVTPTELQISTPELALRLSQMSNDHGVYLRYRTAVVACAKQPTAPPTIAADLVHRFEQAERELIGAAAPLRESLELEGQVDPGWLLRLANYLAYQPEIPVDWWIHDDPELLRDLIDACDRTFREQREQAAEIRDTFGDDWPALEELDVSALRASLDDIAAMIKLDDQITARQVLALTHLAETIAPLVEKISADIEELESFLGADLSDAPLTAFQELVQIAAESMTGVRPYDAWADPDTAIAAETVLETAAPLINEAADAFAAIETKFLDGIWDLSEAVLDDERAAKSSLDALVRPKETVGVHREVVAELRHAYALRTQLRGMDLLAARTLGPHWRRELTDVHGVRRSLAIVEQLRGVRGSGERVRLSTLLRGDVLSTPDFVQPATRAAQETVMWIGRAGAAGLRPQADRLTFTELQEWAADLPGLVARFDTCRAALPAGVHEQPIGEILDKVEAARGDTTQLRGTAMIAQSQLGVTDPQSADWDERREAVHWLNDLRVAWAGRPVPNLVANRFCGAPPPDVAEIEAALAQYRVIAAEMEARLTGST